MVRPQNQNGYLETVETCKNQDEESHEVGGKLFHFPPTLFEI